MFVMGKKRGPRNPPGVTREAVRELLEEGLSAREVARRLDIRKSTVAYHSRRFGIEPDRRFAMRYDWRAIRASYDSGLSVRECMLKFGFSSDAWSKAVARGDVTVRPRIRPLEEFLVAGRQIGRCNLKRRLLAEGLKENRCERCGLTEWNGEPLNMQLHHKDGDGTNNTLENLELLCPNCHAQTDTYGGRNGHRRKKAA
jgi:hypothetical protein